MSVLNYALDVATKPNEIRLHGEPQFKYVIKRQQVEIRTTTFNHTLNAFTNCAVLAGKRNGAQRGNPLGYFVQRAKAELTARASRSGPRLRRKRIQDI